MPNQKIEIKHLNGAGTYDTLYPKTLSINTIISDATAIEMGLSSGTTVDEALSALQLKKTQYEVGDIITTSRNAVGNLFGEWKKCDGSSLQRSLYSELSNIIQPSTLDIINNGNVINETYAIKNGPVYFFLNNYYIIGYTREISSENFQICIAYATSASGPWTISVIYSLQSTSSPYITSMAYQNGYYFIGITTYSSNWNAFVLRGTSLSGPYSNIKSWTESCAHVSCANGILFVGMSGTYQQIHYSSDNGNNFTTINAMYNMKDMVYVNGIYACCCWNDWTTYLEYSSNLSKWNNVNIGNQNGSFPITVFNNQIILGHNEDSDRKGTIIVITPSTNITAQNNIREVTLFGSTASSSKIYSLGVHNDNLICCGYDAEAAKNIVCVIDSNFDIVEQKYINESNLKTSDLGLYGGSVDSFIATDSSILTLPKNNLNKIYYRMDFR